MAKAFITSSGTFSIATDGSPITVEVIGGGGGGHDGDGGNVGTGGGGGAYALKTVAYASNASITVVVGSGGAPNTDGVDSDWNSGVVLAKGGQGGQSGAGGVGGDAASCVPTSGAFSGGDGGDLGSNSRAGAGGGGAAGPNGDGQDGGVGGAGPDYNGAGGGGAGGGSSTPGGNSVGSDPSGVGGDAQDGTPGAAGVSTDGATGNTGSHGAGGSGGAGSAAAINGGTGGTGGLGIEFDAFHGAGGGAGGGGGSGPANGGTGGTGGLYGGGGGGGGFPSDASTFGRGGVGGAGIIVVTYTSSDLNLFPSTGSIALTPGTPTVTLSTLVLSPAAGSIALTGATSTVSLSGSTTLTPASGTITLTPGTPVVHLDSGLVLYPDAGHITITGGTPIVTIPIVLFPATGQIQLNGGLVGVSLVRTGGTGNQLYIGDMLFACGWKESTFRITKALSGDWSAEFKLDFYGGYDPQSLIGQEVAMIWQSVKRFGGLVQSVAEESVQGNGPLSGIPHTILTIKVGGYQLLTDRVIVADLVTLSRGGVNGIDFYNIWYNKLRQFGVSKIGDAPNIFCGEQLFHYITVTECFNRLKAMAPGYDWWIDDDKLLHYEDTSATQAANAPFTIRNSDRNVDFMTVSTSNVRFRNRQFDLPSADLVALRDDHRLGDGFSTDFATDYVLTAKPIVRVGGIEQLVVEFGDWQPGWQFYYLNGGVGVVAVTAPPSLETVDILYPNPFPVAEVAEDAASIEAVGPYESVWQSKNVLTRSAAQAEAQGLLDLYSSTGFPQEIQFEYNSENQPAWLLPGMIMDVLRNFPTAAGKFTVEQVDSQIMSNKIWKHSVTMRAGLGDVTDSQALEQFRISARVPINSPPYRLTGELFSDLPGIPNPGASVGPIKNTFVCQCAGVISSWDIIFPDDPPTGDDFQMDVLLNGVSIFPAGDGNQVVSRDGVTTLQQGVRFLADNTPVAAGNLITLNVLQVGSTFPGANCTFHLNIKVPANAGTA